jgi:hypothetical protein
MPVEEMDAAAPAGFIIMSAIRTSRVLLMVRPVSVSVSVLMYRRQPLTAE